MSYAKRFLSVSVAMLLATTACVSASVSSSAPAEYLCWLEELKEEMIDKGISKKTIKKVYAQDYYQPEPEVVKIDRKQIEFALISTDYINRVVSKKRVEEGRKKYKTLKPLLDKIEKKYGVQPEYLVAFWGVETNYGASFGGFNTIAALTSLSYDKRRASFFRGQLYQALKIIDEWDVDHTQMQGSWAGAMGHFQFMPSTFNAYAVDFDGDQKIDIWRSFEDAAASAANYLSSIGWQKNKPWGMEVSLPWNFDFSLSGRNKFKTVAEWEKIGIKAKNKKTISSDKNMKASIVTPEGKKGSAYLVFENFHKIMHWNRSENYALAVGILADYIRSDKAWKARSIDPALRLKTDDVIKVQSFINKMGWFSLKEDGQLGTQTREAVKKLQKKARLTQDGYPDYQLLRKIRNYDSKIGFAIPVPKRKLHKDN
ncbi:MAG: lytic murein transglycosylase [Alphaproteobacteria bacterium]|nr:lytic murein transglycosylase [Alphaproteobacteria bacterium]